MAENSNFPLPIIGSVVRWAFSTNLRAIRVDDQGRLDVVIGGGAVMDVNLAQVAGTATVEAGVAGAQAVGGVDDAGDARTSNPLTVSGVDLNGIVRALFTDPSGRPQNDIDRIANTDVVATGVLGMMPVAGDVADDAVASASNPAKIGAVADQVPSTVADGDMVHLITDLERYLRVVSKAYDSLTAADKVAVRNTIASDRDEAAQTLADESDHAAGTVYYPSSAGLEIGNRDFLSFILSLDDVTSVAFQVSNDGSTWVDGTGAVVDCATGVSGYASTHFTGPDGSFTDFAVDWEKCGFRYIRLAVLYPDNGNAIEVTLIQRAI